jgi:hypothetical protein
MSEKESREPYYFEDPQVTRPLTAAERLGLKAYHMSMEYSGPGQSLQSPHAKDSFREVMDDIAKGNAYSHPIQKEKGRSYIDVEVELAGESNIPQEGSFIVVSNHYNRGVHKGMPQGPIMAHEISRLLPDGNNRKFIPVIENIKHLVAKTEKNTRLDKVYPRLPEAAARSLHQSVEAVVGPADKIANQILFNTSVVFGMIPTSTHSREIFKVFRNGDVLILFPTGKDEFELHEVNPMAGKLAELAGAKNVPLLPIGYWFNPQTSTYQIKIGESFLVVRDKKNPDSSTQNAHEIGVRIASLLPETMQGEYRKAVNDSKDYYLTAQLAQTE